jgi:TolA-binding protein
MNCREIEEQDIRERYLLKQLPEPERDEFERHYFECDACFSQLQTELALQKELERQPLVLKQARCRPLRPMWLWAPPFAALAILLATAFWWYSPLAHRSQPQTSSARSENPQTIQSQSPPENVALEKLARVEPPAYSPILLRGAEDEAQQDFDSAMTHYIKGDYVGAISGLRAAAHANPESAKVRFYLGACYLLAGQIDSSVGSFRKAVSLNDSTYSGRAHFYLAKAYLKKQDVSSATEELRLTVRLGGNMAPEAAEILYQLGK